MASKPTKIVFKIARHDARTLSWWYSKRNVIDMSPSYQRKGERWNLEKKQYLIDSIVNGFDIPKIYLADFTWENSQLNESGKSYAVIDGKQRLESIFDFLSGKLKLGSKTEYKQDPSKNISNLTYQEIRNLHEDISDIIDNFNLDVMSVITNDPKLIDDLFYRLNSSSPLSGAEIRNSISGEVALATRRISGHDFFKLAKFNQSQGQHQNCATKILLFQMKGTPSETKKRNLDDFARSGISIDEKLLSKIEGTLESMSKSFNGIESALRTEGQIPVYYLLFSKTPKRLHRKLAIFIDESLKSLKSPPSKAGIKKKDATDFMNASRSINDKSSHETRLRILHEYFNKSG